MLVMLSAFLAIALGAIVFGAPLMLGKLVYDEYKKLLEPAKLVSDGEYTDTPKEELLKMPDANAGVYGVTVRDQKYTPDNSVIETPEMKRKFEELQKRNSIQG